MNTTRSCSSVVLLAFGVALLCGGCVTATAPELKPAAVEATATELGPVFDVARVDVKPAPRTRTGPAYPMAMRRAGVSGEAIVEFVVDTQGNVRNPFVLRATHFEFGQEAVATVSRWKFSPGKKDDQLVSTRMQVPIVFSMNGN